eukprot:gene9959-13392_t
MESGNNKRKKSNVAMNELRPFEFDMDIPTAVVIDSSDAAFSKSKSYNNYKSKQNVIDDEEEGYDSDENHKQVNQNNEKGSHSKIKSSGTDLIKTKSSNSLLQNPSAMNLMQEHNKLQIKKWPNKLRENVKQSFSLPINEAKGKLLLDSYLWPPGLQLSIFKCCKKIAIRFFIVDDSGSMNINDGKKLVSGGTDGKIIKCTRWSELSESMMFLASLSEALNVPSEFRLLNGADPVMVGLSDDNGESMEFLRDVMSESPAGPTPLCQHIESVANEISLVADKLRAKGQKAAVIISTDGESTDGDVANALRPLINLPVLVVIRLCTDEKSVVDYWNNIDNQLELDIDVIDDHLGDAKQVAAVNGWLTYGEPIHRMREFGASMKEMDIIDESTLSSEQMRIICGFLFLGGNPKDLPIPAVDWKSFVNKVKTLNKNQSKIFCPIHNCMMPWINIAKLNHIYSAECNRHDAGNASSCVIS